MVAFFNTLSNIFSTIIDFVMMFVNGIVTLIQMLPESASYIKSLFEIIPPFLLPFVLGTVSFSIILLIIGRKSDKG